MSEALYQDEAVFLAHSVALEQEATERLYELADTLEIHNNRSLSSLLRELAAYSEQHARQVAGLCQGHSLPGLRAWEYAWPQDESPEVFHYSQVHYLLQAEQALQVALEVEQNAAAFAEHGLVANVGVSAYAQAPLVASSFMGGDDFLQQATVPPFGFGDPTSYKLIEDVVRAHISPCISHRAEQTRCSLAGARQREIVGAILLSNRESDAGRAASQLARGARRHASGGGCNAYAHLC